MITKGTPVNTTDKIKSILAKINYLEAELDRKDLVRTPEGARVFGQPIGTVIRRDHNVSLPGIGPLRLGNGGGGRGSGSGRGTSAEGHRGLPKQRGPGKKAPVARRKKPTQATSSTTTRGTERIYGRVNAGDFHPAGHANAGAMTKAAIDSKISKSKETPFPLVRYSDNKRKIDAQLKKFGLLDAKGNPPWHSKANRPRDPHNALKDDVLVTESILTATSRDQIAGNLAQVSVKSPTEVDKRSGLPSWKWQPVRTPEAQAAGKAKKHDKIAGSEQNFQQLDGNVRSDMMTKVTNKAGQELPGNPLSALIYMIMTTGMRPGSEDKDTEVGIGATDLKVKHVKRPIKGNKVTFEYVPGKAAKNDDGSRARTSMTYDDPVLAQLIKHWTETRDPEDALFYGRDSKGRDTKINYKGNYDPEDPGSVSDPNGFVKHWSGNDSLEVRNLRTRVATLTTQGKVNWYVANFADLPRTKTAFNKLRKVLAEEAQQKLGHANPSMTISNYIDPRVWTPLVGDNTDWLK